MRIILEETQNAHTEWPEYGDDIQECGKFNNLHTAVRAYRQHLENMHKYCGIGAWSHNHRLIYTNGQLVDDDAIELVENELEDFAERHSNCH